MAKRGFPSGPLLQSVVTPGQDRHPSQRFPHVAIDVREEHTARIVRRILAERDAGARLRGIATPMAAVQPVGLRGGQWHASTVREVLLNERDYRGNARGASAVRWPAIL